MDIKRIDAVTVTMCQREFDAIDTALAVALGDIEPEHFSDTSRAEARRVYLDWAVDD